MRAVIRADASAQIGSGHIMRTAALAAVLRKHRIDCRYLVKPGLGNLAEMLRADALEVCVAEDDSRLDAALHAMAPFEIVIVDHYEVDEQWERHVREYARCVVAIDDLGRSHDCDLLLDQNFGANPEGYAGKVPDCTTLLLGPRYALLRAEFRPYAAHSPQRSGTIRNVLVSMGGFDATDETGKVIEALNSPELGGLHVDVVLPYGAPHAASASAACRRAGFTYHGHVRTMSALMAAADVAIGTMGVTAWERCLLGLPSLVITVAENQRAGAAACHAAGIARWLGDACDVSSEAVRDELKMLAQDPAAVRAMGLRGRSAVAGADGAFSTDKVADTILEVLYG